MRRRRPERRKILPDPVFKDLSISKFINYLMKGGKKGVAEKIFYNALDIIKQKTKSDGIKIFEKAIEKYIILPLRCFIFRQFCVSRMIWLGFFLTLWR